MSSPFITMETYDVPLVDPRDGKEWKAQLRTLHAGDRALIQDETVIETVDEGGERSRIPMGSLRMKTVQLAVVSWDLPLPPTPQTIATLHPALFDQLYEAARFGGEDPAGPPTEAPTESPSPELPAGSDS